MKPLSYLGNRVKDSLILREVNGGRDGPPLSPGDGNNLTTEWQPCQWWLLQNGPLDGADALMIWFCLRAHSTLRGRPEGQFLRRKQEHGLTGVA